MSNQILTTEQVKAFLASIEGHADAVTNYKTAYSSLYEKQDVNDPQSVKSKLVENKKLSGELSGLKSKKSTDLGKVMLDDIQELIRQDKQVYILGGLTAVSLLIILSFSR
jgi:adenine-specific DNA methylase